MSVSLPQNNPEDQEIDLLEISKDKKSFLKELILYFLNVFSFL
jgi:hypothetical protein